MPYTRQGTLLDVTTSDVTGGPFFIGDFTQLTLSYVTQTGTASNLTVQMSNADGFASSIPEASYSNVTIMASQGMFGVETGSRWLRILRKSASSATLEVSGLVNR